MSSEKFSYLSSKAARFVVFISAGPKRAGLANDLASENRGDRKYNESSAQMMHAAAVCMPSKKSWATSGLDATICDAVLRSAILQALSPQIARLLHLGELRVTSGDG